MMKGIIVIFIGINLVSSSLTGFDGDEEEKLLAEFEIIDMELQDKWDSISAATRSALITSQYDNKINAEVDLGNLLQKDSTNLKNYTNIPYYLERNYSVIVKPGDALLPENKLLEVLNYSNSIEKATVFNEFSCNENFYNFYNHQKLNENKTDGELQEECWSNYQNTFGEVGEYTRILKLVKDAAQLNEKQSVQEYWEFLLDQETSFDKAVNLWREIEPFYLKLLNFVKIRLYQYHNITFDNESEIPVYLLGSNFGDDWSRIAEIILPHAQIHYDANYHITRKTVEEMFKLAERTTQELSLGSLGDRFWENSLFNMSQCQNFVNIYCNEHYSEVLTCNESSWSKYLDTFESAFEITLNNQDYTTLPRQELRYSAIDEAIINLGPILAIENLPHNGILDNAIFKNTEDDSNKMAKLLLIALRVLPKLPYYLAADNWRLNLLNDDNFENITQSWWELRRKYQGVVGVTNEEPDFLGDVLMAKNKLYIHKFFGVLMAFQLINNYQSTMTNPEDNVALEIGKDENFRTMLHARSTNSWPYIINNYYGFYDIEASPLLQFFQPLENYFNSAPLKQQDILKTTPKPTTTTTTTTTTRKPPGEILQKSVDLKNIPTKVVLNDQPSNQTTNSTKPAPESVVERVTTFIGFILLGLLAFILVVTLFYTKLKKRNRRPNNRRFES